MIVIAIMIIISITLMSIILSVLEDSKRDVCKSNRYELKRSYEVYKVLNEVEDSEVSLNKFMSIYGDKICPEDGVISKVGEDVLCNEHTHSGEEDEGDETVPFLFVSF